MPTVENFTVSVVVGGVKLPEFEPTELTKLTSPCDAVVESNFNVPGVSYPMSFEEADPFGEKFTQEWPVTPFQVKVTSSSAGCPFGDCWYVLVFVDGTEACRKKLPPGGEALINGYRSRPGDCNSEERAFCFSRPRLLARGESDKVTLTEQQRLDLSCIRVEVYPASFTRTAHDPNATIMSSGAVAGVNKVAAKKGNVGAASRSGKVVTKAASTTTHYYNIDYSRHQCTLRVRYAPMDKLAKIAVVEASDEASSSSSSAAATSSSSSSSSASSSSSMEPAAKKPKTEKKPAKAAEEDGEDQLIDLT